MFKINDAKGFQITFDNGWTASVQFGPGNYCSNRDAEFFKRPVAPSNTAEIAAFKGVGGQDVWHTFSETGDQVNGWCDAAEVLAFLNEVASKP